VSDKATAVILSVGTELTEGIIQNTHFRFLGSELKSLGIEVRRQVQIPDDADLFREELRRAVAGSALVMLTGGLGPTSDDLCREVVAACAGRQLEFREEVWNRIKERLRGRSVPETNRKQALIPQGFELIANPYGTAPGFAGWIDKALVVALPGPPRELEPLYREQVQALLSRQLRLEGTEELVLTSFLVPESLLEEALQRHRQEGVRWGTRFVEDRIAVILRAGGSAQRERMFQALEGEFGPVRIRRGEVTSSLLLFQSLKRRGLTLALAESCSGGQAARMITDIPGSSEVFWGGAVAYANEAKVRLLGVDPALLERHGAVSAEVASAMAAGVLERSGADVAVAITGVAGPGGGSPDKPIGTVWVAAREASGAELRQAFHFPGAREMIRLRAAVAALLLAETLVEKRDLAFPLWS